MIDVMKKFVAFACDFRPRVVDIALPTLSDGNMEMADTSAWGVWSGAVLSKVSPGYSGTRCLRADTGGPTRGAYQVSILESGKPFRIRGWCRGTAAQRLIVGSTVQFDFPISADWQRIDVSGTSDGDRLYLLSGGVGAGYVEFDDIEVIQPRSCIPNFGQAGGAPRWMMIGDGYTATTFPTPLAGYGATFDGGDYINTGIVDRYERTDQFSLYWYGNTRPADKFGIIGNSSSSHGILMEEASGNMRIRLVGSNGTLIQNAGPAMRRSVGSSVISFAGTAASITYYINGTAVAGTVNINNLNASIKNGCPWAFSTTYWNPRPPTVASGNRLVGDSFAFGVADGLLTPQEIYETDTKVKAGMR